MDLNDVPKPGCGPSVSDLSEGTVAFSLCLQNWMRNSLKVHSDSVLEQVWNIFSEASSSVSPLHFAVAVWQTAGNNRMVCCVGGWEGISTEPLLSPWWASLSWEHPVCRGSHSACMWGSGPIFGMIGTALGWVNGNGPGFDVWLIWFWTQLCSVCLIMSHYLASDPQFPNLKHPCCYTLFIYSLLIADLKCLGVTWYCERNL